jgi:hypothetical protein
VSAFDSISEDGVGTLYVVFGVGVTYRRGETETELTAVPSDPSNKWSDVESAGVWAGFKVWTFRCADLALLPERGDEIEDAAGNVWRVASPEGAPVYRYVSPEEREIEVATKLYERGA